MANRIKSLKSDIKLTTFAILSLAIFSFSSAHSAPSPAFSYAESAGGWLGENIANAGDVNNDGTDDIIVGARNHGGTRGLATVLSGVDGSILYRYEGFSQAYLGSSVDGIGDINGDNFDDFAIGEFSTGPGKIIVRSGINGAILLEIVGGPYGTMGRAVAGVGDVNNDGVPDIGIGVNGVVRIHSGVGGGLLFTLYADVSGVINFGEALDGAGDVNADGYDDVVVGARYQGELEGCWGRGKAYVFSGKDASLMYSYIGETCPEHVGSVVAGLGDLNSDGYADFGVGSTGKHKVYSGIDGSEMYELWQQGSSLWPSLGLTSDIDGDGIFDIVAGSNRGKFVIYSGATGLRAAWSGWANPILDSVYGGRMAGAGDFNSDGITDLAFADYWDSDKAGIVHGLPVTPGVDCCFIRGDFVPDGKINIVDVTASVSRVFSGGNASACPEDADANGDGKFNISDVTFLIRRVFAQQALMSCLNGQ